MRFGASYRLKPPPAAAHLPWSGTSVGERHLNIDLDAVFAAEDAAPSAIPLTAVSGNEALAALDFSPAERVWVEANGFDCAIGRYLALPGDQGISRVLIGLSGFESREPSGSPAHAFGQLPSRLPPAVYRIDPAGVDVAEAALAWGLGGYRYETYRSPARARPQLSLDDVDGAERVRALVSSIWLGRNLINCPSNDLGPGELAGEVERISVGTGAKVKVYDGMKPDFAKSFPLLHAVGRASTRPPAVADLTWNGADPDDERAPRVTLIGKGICFDTGGLDIKPAAGMRYMKKDMGGAATAIALARMIMLTAVPVRLRLIVVAAENAIAGNAFRPGDIIKSRDGLTVEIGNTDAEGRLALADGITLAEDTGDPPDLLMTFATLTGAARVALGPDLPALFTTDDHVAAMLTASGLKCGDPLWRMPLWPGYERLIDSTIADIQNVGDGPMGGAITAALFLKRFVRRSSNYAHIDMYGWRQAATAMGPAGGEPQTARAALDAISRLADLEAD